MATGGAVFINLGLLVSVFGAFLGWTILCAEIPFLAAKEKIFPACFGLETQTGSSKGSLLITNGIIQVFLIIILFSESTYRTLFMMSSTASILPYLFAALFQLQLTRQTLSDSNKYEAGIGIFALLYTLWLCYAAGFSNWLYVSAIYLPSILVYLKACREYDYQKRFRKVDYGIIFLLFAAFWGGVYTIIGPVLN